MTLSRRAFSIGCSAAIAAMSGGKLGGLAFASPHDTTQRDMLVVVSLRGGLDGLGLIAPIDDSDYVAARPAQLRITAKGDTAGIALNHALPGGDFRFHANATGLHELYQSGDLAIVHACGLTDSTRSHFEAMDLMERGAEQGRPALSGWIARHLQSIGASGALPAVAANSSQPLSLMAAPAVAVPNPAEFGLSGHWRYSGQHQDALRSMYRGTTLLDVAARHTLDAINTIGAAIPRDANQNPLPYETEGDHEYPTDDAVAELTEALQSVARLIKLDLGLQVATVDYGGWDTHEGQSYAFPTLVSGLSRALAAFYNDLARYHKRVTIVVLSEFGRRLKANNSGGTDHGHGNAMLVLGGNVRGGRMYGRWPGLAADQLDDGDLAITTDYRAVLSEILAARLANPNAKTVFPGMANYQRLGLVAGQ
jgi:uncharacterized protein (DUF1501 family)